MRLSSGPEHSLLTNRPVIVTQSVLPSSHPKPLRQRGSPYSLFERRASARPLELKLGSDLDSARIAFRIGIFHVPSGRPCYVLAEVMRNDFERHVDAR